MSGSAVAEQSPAVARRRRQVNAPVVAGVLIALAILIHAPSLRWGFLYDDFIHQYLLRYAMDWPGASPTRLYEFSFWTRASATLPTGSLAPWWTSPDFRAAFLRPITSLTIWLDYRLYHDWTPGYHVTNLALFALLALLAYRLYVDLDVPPRAALWALAFFALEDNHSLPVGWIANRNDLLAILFVVATMLAVHRHRRRGGLHWLAVAVACFLCASASKESALIGLPLVGLYLFVLDSPPPSESFLQRCTRVLRSTALWVFILVTAAWLGVYLATGHGTTSVNYVTPWHQSAAYLGRVATLFPLASASLFFGLPADLVFTRPQLFVPMLSLSVVLFASLAWIMWRRLRAVPLAWFAAGWIAAALLPVAGVPLSDRLLMSASAGSSLLLGLFMDRQGSFREIIANLRSRWPALVFIATGLVLSVPMVFVRGHMFYAMAAADRAAITAADVEGGGKTPPTVFVLNSPSILLSLTQLPTWAVVHNDSDIIFHILSMARRGLICYREADDTLVLTFETPLLLTYRYERYFLTSDDPPPPGTAFTIRPFTATVLATEGRGIKSARFKFRQSLDDAAYQFLAWQGGRFQRITPPPIGGTLYLPAPEPLVKWAP